MKAVLFPTFSSTGRNFNNGEVIQLVLKSPSTGKWLPFRFVQMVLMHELAHCTEMNHSKAFWKLRNQFADEMKALWAKGYTGEGLWGRGVPLSNDTFIREDFEEGEVMPENMCGGTFKSRVSRKRKSKPKMTYKEREERRIKKKFGTNGNILCANQEAKSQQDTKNRRLGKPRVAASQRGRELRAAAALARFQENSKEVNIKDEDSDTDCVYISDREEEIGLNSDTKDAIDINGQPILDRKGQGMINVCKDENRDDCGLKQELQDVLSLYNHSYKSLKNTPNHSTFSVPKTIIEKSTMDCTEKKDLFLKATETHSLDNSERRKDLVSFATDNITLDNRACSTCSFINSINSLTCSICLNVLRPDFDPESWTCERSTCKDKPYKNASDVVFCGICASRKHSAN